MDGKFEPKSIRDFLDFQNIPGGGIHFQPAPQDFCDFPATRDKWSVFREKLTFSSLYHWITSLLK
jgi:hypothetical protein